MRPRCGVKRGRGGRERGGVVEPGVSPLERRKARQRGRGRRQGAPGLGVISPRQRGARSLTSAAWLVHCHYGGVWPADHGGRAVVKAMRRREHRSPTKRRRGAGERSELARAAESTGRGAPLGGARVNRAGAGIVGGPGPARRNVRRVGALAIHDAFDPHKQNPSVQRDSFRPRRGPYARRAFARAGRREGCAAPPALEVAVAARGGAGDPQRPFETPRAASTDFEGRLPPSSSRAAAK